ncbi:hypothetical protein FRACYDRAFT_271680 [Fragilariopsis cylindrus CCMP1102]|uniref:Uncharacterized protein n=1 Tax=Fragilariopsis cylindrus CCMP1102 TaxID=635003 RepID=A0A1E7ES75_9STRA|nr:hypothetical protein FRACYDRAFT_271680 [Fragilariopsis cylindrus CCMP1102]|eukprot:OEU08413.1 hypothetical protein FRACYDRAFT_271680 [Fragilariopsis cylindrus CCMP1102]
MIATIAHSFLLCVFLSTCLMWQVESRRPNIRIPFLSSSSSKKKYTPLVFFTFPKGYIDECDEMEKVVSEVEKEVGCQFERLDVARDPAAEAAMSLLTRERGPPFLYNRESCQIMHGSPPRTAPSRKTKDDDKEEKTIDKARVRALAKGRYLPPIGVKVNPNTKKSAPGIVVSQEDSSFDQTEVIKESSLTPEQLEGKRAMEQRAAAQTAADN